jgi:hypothetical protein
MTFSGSASHWFLSFLPTSDLLFDMAELDPGPVTSSMRSALSAQLNKEPQIERDPCSAHQRDCCGHEHFSLRARVLPSYESPGIIQPLHWIRKAVKFE